MTTDIDENIEQPTSKRYKVSEIKEIFKYLEADKWNYEIPPRNRNNWTMRIILAQITDEIDRYLNLISIIEKIVNDGGDNIPENSVTEYTQLYNNLTKLHINPYMLERENFPIEGLTIPMADNIFIVDTSKVSDEDFQFVNPFKNSHLISKELDDLVNPLKIKFVKDISQVHIIEEIDLNKKVSEIPTEEIKFATTNEEY